MRSRRRPGRRTRAACRGRRRRCTAFRERSSAPFQGGRDRSAAARRRRREPARSKLRPRGGRRLRRGAPAPADRSRAPRSGPPPGPLGSSSPRANRAEGVVTTGASTGAATRLLSGGRLGGGAGHLALTLSRPGSAEVGETDDEWTEALQRELDDRIDGAWSLHVSVGDWIVRMVEPWTWKREPRGLHASAFRAAVELNRWSAWLARPRRVRLPVPPRHIARSPSWDVPVAGRSRPAGTPSGERCASRTAIPLLSAVRIASADG